MQQTKTHNQTIHQFCQLRKRAYYLLRVSSLFQQQPAATASRHNGQALHVTPAQVVFQNPPVSLASDCRPLSVTLVQLDMEKVFSCTRGSSRRRPSLVISRHSRRFSAVRPVSATT